MVISSDQVRASIAAALTSLDEGRIDEARDVLKSSLRLLAECQTVSFVEPHRSNSARVAAAVCLIGSGIEVPNIDHYGLADGVAWIAADALGATHLFRNAAHVLPLLVLSASGGGFRLEIMSPSEKEVGTEVHQTALRFLLARVRAERSMNEKVYHRVLWAAREAGLPQREIAQIVEQPQTTVFRRLKAVDDDPSLLSCGPRELHDAHVAGRIDRPTLVALLSAYPYDDGRVEDAEADWAYVPGSWDELSQLTIEGSISPDEFDAIVDAVTERAVAP